MNICTHTGVPTSWGMPEELSTLPGAGEGRDQGAICFFDSALWTWASSREEQSCISFGLGYPGEHFQTPPP